jgi:two-component system, LytTR family, sensor kinase
MKKETRIAFAAFLVTSLCNSLMAMWGAQGNSLLGIFGLPFTFLDFFLLYYPHKWLIDNYLKQNRKIVYALGLITWIGSNTLWNAFIMSHCKTLVQINFLAYTEIFIVLISVSTVLHYGYQGIILQFQLEKAKRQQIESELKLLQTQVNPHFLFNVLNNIYAKNLVQPLLASDMLMQLADLMRYQIESAKKDKVPIQDDIAFIENYLALEKKQLTHSIRTNFEVEISETLTLESVNIPPMLFTPFIENAYKHGISEGDDNFIFISLNIKNQEISFKIKNKIPSSPKKIVSTKMGLENIEKRLNLLFPNKYQLTVTTNNQIYAVKLDLDI